MPWYRDDLTLADVAQNILGTQHENAGDVQADLTEALRIIEELRTVIFSLPGGCDIHIDFYDQLGIELDAEHEPI